MEVLEPSIGHDIRAITEQIEKESAFLDLVSFEVHKAVVGQKYMIERLFIGILTNGHILLEGLPGLAKTLTINSLSQAFDGKFSRIQFTPDLLPADLVGTMVYNQATAAFQVRKGPIFAHFVLADEINRAPAKVQSALLEAMQEKQVTIGDTSFLLQEPFLVLATQNPIEQEGTYPLPEAQIDRFMLKIRVGYPSMEEERLIMRQNTTDTFRSVQKVASLEQIMKARSLVKQVYLDEKIEKYILDIVFATRTPAKYKLDKLDNLIAYGASPRASINLALAAKAHAFLKKRGYVTPDDVRAVCADVLRHRIGLSYEAEAENVGSEHIIAEVLNAVDVP
ncbi:MAG: MoxR family ATPase [Bacteroidetes bacterium]|jgi:MoxR-like ATPase|nr:MoxR family ATPase [Bacteroidota bacterium]